MSPLSDVIYSGRPKRDIQSKIRVLTQSIVVVGLRCIGPTASGQREVLSIIVYVNPSKDCNDPSELI